MQVFILILLGGLVLEAAKIGSLILFLVFASAFVGTLMMILKSEGAF